MLQIKGALVRAQKMKGLTMTYITEIGALQTSGHEQKKQARTPRSFGRLHVAIALFAILTFGLLTTTPAWTQVVGATLSGEVADASHAVVPGAKISAKNIDTGVITSIVTDASGVYTVPNLLPGAYELTITAPGFSTEIRRGITLAVGQQQSLNLTLQIGKVTQTVQVTEEQPNIELASSAISGNVNQKEVVDLPLNGRDWTLLAALQPGISSLASIQDPVTNGTNRGNRGYGTQLSVNGGRPSQNNYRIDGISVNDYVNGGPGGVLGSTLGVDAISEFSVLSTNYSAEYGRTSGGVVNAITRSGSNRFQGDAYEFARNSVMDAPTYVDKIGGIPKPDFSQNQFGASVGGPIQRERTFFFADYEGVRQSLGLTTLDTVPSPDARNGILNFASPASFPTGCTPTAVTNQCQVTVDTNVKPFLGLWPMPNAGLIAPGNTGTYAIDTRQGTSEDFVTGRIDRKFSDRDSMLASYEYDNGTLQAPDALNNVEVGNKTTRQFVGIEETHVFSPQLIDNLRIGFSRMVALNGYGIGVVNKLAADTTLGSLPGKDNPGITVSGITVDAGGENSLSDYAYHHNSYQIYDDAFLTKGKHGIKFGGGVERISSIALASSNPGGAFTFGSLAAFLTNQGQGSSFVSEFPSALGSRDLRSLIFGTYFQDDFHWFPNLTLNVGVRYEISTVPSEAHGKLATLATPTSALPNCGTVIAGCAGQGPAFYNPTFRNIEPRVGFAWDPFSNGKTSVRGGFGLYDVLPLPYEILSPVPSSAPFFLSGSVSNYANGDFPTGAFNAISASPHLRTEYIQQNPQRNYVMQWNLNIQREIAPNTMAMIAFIGSRGLHQPYHSSDANIVLPALTPQGYEWPCGGTFNANGLCSKPGTGTLENTHIGQMDTVRWNEDSYYDALELEVTKKLSHSFEVQGAYTWGRAIDEGTSGFTGDAFANGLKSSLAWFNPLLDRGPADFNIQQQLSVNALWQIHAPGTLPKEAWLLGGWQLGGIYSIRTGTPFSLQLGGDPLGEDNTQPYDFPNRIKGSGCESPVNAGNFTNYIKSQCFAFPNPSTLLGNAGRNSLYGPGLVDLDVSVFKNNYIKRISDTFNVQLRAELFNVLNRVNLASPTDHNQPFNNVGTPVGGFGVLDLLATPARETQLAVKVIW